MVRKLSAQTRFWNKVDKRGGDECWLWKASCFPGGYGQFSHNSMPVGAHRFAYEMLVGKIPIGLTLDHLCRTPACVNPQHLEPVSLADNIRRGTAGIKAGQRMSAKTHCPHNHPYDLLNTQFEKPNTRRCRICTLLKYQRYNQKRKLKTTPVSEQSIP